MSNEHGFSQTQWPQQTPVRCGHLCMGQDDGFQGMHTVIWICDALPDKSSDYWRLWREFITIILQKTLRSLDCPYLDFYTKRAIMNRLSLREDHPSGFPVDNYYVLIRVADGAFAGTDARSIDLGHNVMLTGSA